MKAEKSGRLLVKALRHTPELLGLTLDKRGWANVSDVLKSLKIDRSCLDIIVSTDNKQRLEYNETHTKIRASQGHSIKNIEVYKDWDNFIPQGPLYHGTADSSVNSIMSGTLVSRTRTHVHLSKDVETAMIVGARHGKPVILEIDAIKMSNDGYDFYESKNGVILVDEVPSKYISVLDMGLLISKGLIEFKYL